MTSARVGASAGVLLALLLAGCASPSGAVHTFPIDVPPAVDLLPSAEEAGLPLEAVRHDDIFGSEGAVDGASATFRENWSRPDVAVGVTRYASVEDARAAYLRAARDFPEPRTSADLADEAMHAAWQAADIHAQTVLMRAANVVWIVQTSHEADDPSPREALAIARAALARMG